MPLEKQNNKEVSASGELDTIKKEILYHYVEKKVTEKVDTMPQLEMMIDIVGKDKVIKFIADWLIDDYNMNQALGVSEKGDNTGDKKNMLTTVFKRLLASKMLGTVVSSTMGKIVVGTLISDLLGGYKNTVNELKEYVKTQNEELDKKTIDELNSIKNSIINGNSSKDNTVPNGSSTDSKTGGNASSDTTHNNEKGGDSSNIIEKRRDTTLGDELGDFVKPAKTGKNSCGKAVATILRNFGITGIPDKGRYGHKWNDRDFLGKTSGLTRNGKPIEFIKVPIDTPYDALPGAVLVYEKGAGSEMRKKYGHVEIKGADGKYYHYAKSDTPGGSAVRPEKKAKSDPTGYQKATSFCGYAYYPVLKKNADIAYDIAQDAQKEGERIGLA